MFYRAESGLGRVNGCCSVMEKKHVRFIYSFGQIFPLRPARRPCALLSPPAAAMSSHIIASFPMDAKSSRPIEERLRTAMIELAGKDLCACA